GTELFDQARVDVELDDVALRVAPQSLMESDFPAVSEPHDLQIIAVAQIAANLRGKAHAHVLGNLLGLARERRDFRNGLQNEMEIANGNALGEQHFEHALQA